MAQDRRLGSALRLVRVYYEAGQADVARRAGLCQSALSAIEHGDRRPQPARALAILEAIVDAEATERVAVPT